ncbi:MAG TPA: hypothetical protein VIL46_18730 [Gemmataceae bacterium]
MKNGSTRRQPAPPSPYAQAQRHLARRHGVWKELIRRVGPCTLAPDRDCFRVLVRSIIAQQISTAAAKSISARLWDLVAPAKLTPARLASLTDEQLRACGLSTAKRRFLRALAEHASARGFLRRLSRSTDEEVAAKLLPIPGIGKWTVEMFLIFGLGRLDVLPVGDLGLRAGAQTWFGLKDLPTPAELTELAEPWRPYRTVATWYLWRSRGFVPQSGMESG